VILSIFHFNSSKEKDSIPLGDAQIKLKDFQPGVLSPESTSNNPNEVLKVVKIINPQNGKPAGEAEVIVSVLTLDEACNVQEHTVYEFQRWSPVHNWGNQDSPIHLLPTDPGRWCSEDGKRFGKDMESVAPQLPPGWEITKSWRTYGTDFDPEGWQYAPLFESPYWYSQNSSSSYVVRRRTWHREIKNTGAGPAKSTDSRGSESKGSGRRKRMFSSDRKK